MHDLLRSVDLKLARADFQVRTITDQISAWCSNNPIMARCELREGHLGYRVILEEFTESPPLDEWGLLVGECIHNLRSALDNLVFALARLRHDPPRNPGAIAFPIYQDRSQFKKHGLSKLDQMSDSAAALIEQLQPFQRNRPEVEGTPETDALVRLQWLNNHDKHRVPSVVLIAPLQLAHSWGVEFHSEEDARLNDPPDATVSFDPLEPGAVLLEYRTNQPIKRAKGDLQGKAIVALQVLEKRPHVVPTLRDLSYYTALVVEQFRLFFQ
jgi:hypothetical protein